MKGAGILGLAAVGLLLAVAFGGKKNGAGPSPTIDEYLPPESPWYTMIEAGGTPAVISSPGAGTGGIPIVELGLAGYYTPVAGGYASIYAAPGEFSSYENAVWYEQFIGNPEALAYYQAELALAVFP